MGLNELEQKLDRFKKFLESDPDNESLLYDATVCALDANDYEFASACVSKGLLSRSNSREFEYLDGVLKRQLGDASAACMIFERLVSTDRFDSYARYHLGYLYLLQGMPEKAYTALVEHVSRVSMQLPQAKIVAARVCHFLGDLSSAQDLLEEYLELFSDDMAAQAFYALIKADLEEFPLAKAIASRVIDADDVFYEARLAYASACMEEFDFAGARSALERACSLNEESGRAWVGIGLIELAQNNLSRAEDFLSRGVRYMPGHIGSWNALAWCRLASNDYQSARLAFNRALEIDGSFSDTYGGLAVLSILESDYENAKRHCKKGLRLNGMSIANLFAKELLESHDNDEKADLANMEAILNSPISRDGRTLLESMNKIAAQGRGGR